MAAQTLNNSTAPPASILETCEKVKAQVEYHAFADLVWRRVDPLYDELCLIISETLVLDPATVLKLNGANLHAALVQEVFSQLRNEHLRLVFENLQKKAYRVCNKKAYLRTALYNAFFEINSHYSCFGLYF